MRHLDLLNQVVTALNEFNPVTQGVQEYIATYIYDQRLEEEDGSFIQEVFAGCMKFRPALEIVVDGFYSTETTKKTSQEKERNLYRVLTYLALYRLDELGVSHFRKFVSTQQVNKMHRFFSFFFDETKLKTWIFAEWCKAYEHSYVQLNLLSPILRWLPELTDFVKKLEDKVNNRKKERDVKPPTEVKAFNLTKPRPRSIPVPEKIPTLKKTKPVPETTYKSPSEQETISTMKEQNKILSEKRLMEASMTQFNCANTEKSDKTKHRIEKYLQEEENRLDFDKHKQTTMPRQIHDNVPIRLNAAAILREGLLIKKKEDEVQRRLEDLSVGGRDDSEFVKWQSEMRSRDLDENLAQIEEKRLSGKLSYEEAILARQALINTNKQRVDDIKMETKEIMDAYLKQKFEREKEMRNLVEKTMEGHQSTKEAQVKLQEFKHSIVQQVNQESQALMKKALEDAEEEMREKVALIARIRAIESVPKIRFKMVDRTETAGAGLLGEMSVAELKERLTKLKNVQALEEERKRNDIIQAKVDKGQVLMDTLESIAKHRSNTKLPNLLMSDQD